MTEIKHPEYRLFGRSMDRPLKARQQRLMAELLPEISVDAETVTPLLKEETRPVWLEIGFGGGEHLAWQAKENPEVLMMGAEPFVNGVAKLMAAIDDGQLSNIRALHGDVRPLLEALPDQSLSRAFVLHPDPWPKKKHHKRRIVSQYLLAHMARLLKPGSELRIASDIPDYIRWTLMHIQRFNREAHEARGQDVFVWQAREKSHWHDRPADWPQTRYEAKAIREGRTPCYLKFIRS